MAMPAEAVPPPDEARALAAQADAAAMAGDTTTAIAALRALLALVPDDRASWMKLSAMSRAAGRIGEALGAVERALALAPLDFTALLLRASLLERTGDAGAGEAYARALVQLPNEPDPALAGIIAHARTQAAADEDRRAAKLERAMAASEGAAEVEAAARLARFRSNALRRTQVHHSEPTHFHFPGLREREYHDRSTFPWLAEIERQVDAVRTELDALLASRNGIAVPYVRYAAHEPLDQWRPLNHNPDWSAFHLLQNGETVAANAAACPQTMALLAALPQPAIPGCSPNAMFSLLAPGTVIPAHRGVTNTRLICHLPLIVPPGCWFRVGAETREWREGEAFVFDDTIEHEAANPSDALRAVLIFDVWHPDLGPAERDGVTAMLAAAAEGPTLGL